MKRQELLDQLLSASELEEAHARKIFLMLSRDIDWENVDDASAKRVRRLLRAILRQTEEHEAMVESLREFLGESNVPDF